MPGVPLSPEQEWSLVAAGLVAHADGVLEVGEWDQVLWLLDERLEAQEAGRWLDLLADRDKLRDHLDTLAPPPPLFAEGILDKAWRMALADGHGSDTEERLHDEIATKLGVDLDEVAEWRTAWTQRAGKRAELIAGFAALIARADETVTNDERLQFDELLERLPLSPERRKALAARLDDPPPLMELVGGMTALPPEDRTLALLGLVPIVRADERGDRARTQFLDLAERVAIGREDAERMLDR
jgi:tellurite resistance protein